MQIGDWLKDLGAAFRGVPIQAPFAGGTSPSVTFTGGAWTGGQDTTPESSSAVVSCVAWIERAVPEPRLRHLDELGEIVENSPAVAAYYTSGSTGVGGDRVAKAAVWGYVCHGNAYLQIVRDLLGRPADLVYHGPDQCSPRRDKETGLLTGYKIAGIEAPLSPEDVVHLAYGVDPAAPLEGISPLRRSATAAMGDAEGDRYVAAILRNPTVIGAAFTPDEPIQPADAEYMTRQLEGRFSGAGRGGTLVASVKGTWSKPGFSPADLDLGSLRNHLEARIAGAIGIPAVVAQLGVGLEHSTFANYEEAREAAIENVLVPLWREWGQALTEQFLAQFGDVYKGHRLEYDADSIAARAADEGAEHDRARADWQADLIDRATFLARTGYEVDDARDKGVFYSQVSSGLTAESLRTRASLRARRKAIDDPEGAAA